MIDNDSIDFERLTASRRQILSAAAGLGAASLATGTVVADEHQDDNGTETPTESGEGENGGDEQQSQPFAAVEFSNQRSGGTDVVVDSVTLSDGGYVAIHDPTLFEGEVVGSVIGVTDYLEAGVHYNVELSLFDVPGADFTQGRLDATTPLVAMPHMETSGNETYDFVASDGQDDGAYALGGLPVVDAGFVNVTEEEADTAAGPFATLDFENQTVDDSVEIRDVTLSEGGFVTLHDARLLQGQPLESVVGASEYLDAGRHQAVEIEIEDPEGITEVALPARPLLPMPHLDTNGNQAYDFVDTEGAEDGPYTKAGQAVIDAGLVVLEGGDDEDEGTETDDDDDETETEEPTETETATGTETETVTETGTPTGTETETPTETVAANETETES